jgi:D-alanyl-D-alanine carboxypeptidase
VTIKQLLNMTSGIKSYSDEDVKTFWNAVKKDPYKQWTPKSLASLAYNKKPNTIFKPGKGWNYSNTNYVLAGMIVERVTGKSFNEIIKEQILSWDKNKLINTYYLPMPYPEDIMQRVVHGYNLTGIFPDNTDVTDYNPSWVDAAGTLVSNSFDLTRFVVGLFSGKVVPQKQFEEITCLVSAETGKPVTDIKEKDGYGLGMDYTYRENIGPIWYKNGETLGYNSFFMWLPCLELAIGITKNNATDDDGIVDLHSGVLDTLLSSQEFADTYYRHI